MKKVLFQDTDSLFEKAGLGACLGACFGSVFGNMMLFVALGLTFGVTSELIRSLVYYEKNKIINH